MGTGSSSSKAAVDARFMELFPGPGEYYKPAAASGGPAYSMGTRPGAASNSGREGGAAESSPGPGEYHRYWKELSSMSGSRPGVVEFC
jgi:hypothetical protein